MKRLRRFAVLLVFGVYLVNKLGGFYYDVVSKWKEHECEAY